MTVEDIREVLAAHRDELAEQHVSSLAVFGSVARGEARADSDVDVLVEFEKPVGYFALAGLQIDLSAWLGREVDLVQPGALKPQLRERILGEAVRAA